MHQQLRVKQVIIILDLLPTCKKLGIGLVAYSPLGRGFLTGQITSRDDLEEGDWRLENARFSEENIKQNLLIVDKINQLAKLKNCSAAQLALAWIAHQGESFVSIPGTRNLNRLVENAGAIDVLLSDQELSEITQLIPSDMVHGDRYG